MTPAAAVVSLNGIWQIAIDPRNRGREEGWSAEPRSPDIRLTRVPSIIQEVFPGYHGVAWYWRTFPTPPNPFPRGRTILRFWAVGYLAEVWVNGQKVGEHEGGETPFTLDVTDAVRADANRLAVRVLNPTYEPIDGITLKQTPHRNKVYPPSPGSDFNHGGIFLPVEMLLVPATRIEDLFAEPDWETGRVHVRMTLRNTSARVQRGTAEIRVAAATGGPALASASVIAEAPKGDSVVSLTVDVQDHRLWSLTDPFLYLLSARYRPSAAAWTAEASTRIGFRDLRVVNGFFRLNGQRIFLRSTHTGNCSPVGQVIPPDAAPDLLRRDLLYAKASGYNTVRFIAMAAHPWELDLCDELGLMVWEESYAAWLLEDSPEMQRRFDLSVREMILRDRNHPSLAIWGLLNETYDGPVFRHAVETLPMMRSLDPGRLVILSSGRWDGQWSIGSLSNPGSPAWEHQWGIEAPDAVAVPARWDPTRGGYLEKAGDAHIYPIVPQLPESDRLIRGLGSDGKPVLLSEYGIGSMMDVVHEARSFRQYRCREDLEDYQMLHAMEVRLAEDMDRWGMHDVYAFPEDLLIASQERMARHRLFGFDLVRSNPRICGFNLTGMLDHALSGEGMWRMWRTWKPGAMDALQNGWWPVRWCLFVDPVHAYAGRAFRIQAVLANEDVLQTGRYPVRFRIMGPKGIAWEKRTEVVLPEAAGRDAPLAVEVLNEEVILEGPTGTYRLVADLEGGAPLNRSLDFYLSDASALPRPGCTVELWGVDPRIQRWLEGHGVSCRPYGGTDPAPILVGVPFGQEESATEAAADAWAGLVALIHRGAAVVFLSHEAFRRNRDLKDGEVDLGHLPLADKGRCYRFHDWLYHKECVAKRHPLFEGLSEPGIMDWYFYGPLIPRYLFQGQRDPGEVIAASFATGYCGFGSQGYESGILISEHQLGRGRFLLNTIPILENVDAHPAADRLLLNLVRYAAGLSSRA